MCPHPLAPARTARSQYEQEIRRKNDLISKKQSEVDKLNRRYAQLTENMKVAAVVPPSMRSGCRRSARPHVPVEKA